MHLRFRAVVVAALALLSMNSGGPGLCDRERSRLAAGTAGRRRTDRLRRPHCGPEATRVESRRARDLESLRDSPVTHQVRRLPRDRALGRSGRGGQVLHREQQGALPALGLRASRTSSSLNDSPMVGSDGHAVIFRQTFGGLPATQDGLITVGVVNGKVAYVSSSSAGDGNAPVPRRSRRRRRGSSPPQNVGNPVSLVNVSAPKADETAGWTGLTVAGLRLQRVRLTALPTPTAGRPARRTRRSSSTSEGASAARLPRVRRRPDRPGALPPQRRAAAADEHLGLGVLESTGRPVMRSTARCTATATRTT